MSEAPNLGILCGGGPAPGLNGVIASATLYATSLGWKVLGFHGGYRFLSTGDPEIVKKNTIELTEELVTPNANQGGSILIPDRYDPTRNGNTSINNILAMLKYFKIRYLAIIGGNDKMACTYLITQGVDPVDMQVIAIPKTIDNDIQLPPDQSTFGYHSARHFATRLVENLIVDARSSPRWFVVELMGKQTGHLALSVANAAGAHLAIIPEDFGDHKVELRDICDIFEAAVYKRLASGKDYGVCVISEGLISKMAPASISALYQNGFISYDGDGKINLDDAELSRAVVNEMSVRLAKRGIDVRVTPKKIGYELRSMAPNSFDSIYGCEMGYGAIEGLRIGHSNCMVVWENGKVFYKSFRSMMDPESGKILPRRVNINAQEYKISRIYFWQLREEDIMDPRRLSSIARCARMSPEDFVRYLGHVPGLTIA